jgi:NADP-dependent 3-hydroxy acid dehydrogenase YdfG
LLFTVREESGLHGARELNRKDLGGAKMCFNVDGRLASELITGAVGQVNWEAEIFGKRILVTGVITDASIAFHVARVAQAEGATVVLTGFGRLSLVERIARRLPSPPPVLELDVTSEDQLASLAGRVERRFGSRRALIAGAALSAAASGWLAATIPKVVATFDRPATTPMTEILLRGILERGDNSETTI